MTPDEIVLLARKADLWITSDERWAAVVRFTRLVEAAERQECIRACDTVDLVGADECIAAIQAREEK